MSDPPWKHLVDELRSRARERSPSSRVGRLLDVAPGQGSIEREILEEMAAALCRAEEKMRGALADLERLEAQIEAARGPDLRVDRIAAFNEKREEALRVRWEYMVHREAIGFRRHDDLLQSFPIPPKRRREVQHQRP